VHSSSYGQCNGTCNTMKNTVRKGLSFFVSYVNIKVKYKTEDRILRILTNALSLSKISIHKAAIFSTLHSSTCKVLTSGTTLSHSKLNLEVVNFFKEGFGTRKKSFRVLRFGP